MNERLHNIQALRGLAALLVVISHVTRAGMAYDLPVQWLHPLENWGNIGVDLFFVISGFVMVYTQKNGLKTPQSFIKNRFLRIAPVYWLLTVCLFAVWWISPASFKGTSIDSGRLLSSLMFVHQVIQGGNPVLFAGWSIEYEMGFYALFALALFIRRMTVVVIVASGAVVAWAILATSFFPMEFVGGMLIGYQFVVRSRPIPWAPVVLLVGLGLVLLTICLPQEYAGHDTARRLWIHGLPSALVVWGAVWSRQWHVGVFERLGNASYSIYLFQIFTIPALYKLGQKMPGFSHHPDGLAVMCAVLTLLFCYVFYEVVEKNLTRLFHRKKTTTEDPLDLKGRIPG